MRQAQLFGEQFQRGVACGRLFGCGPQVRLGSLQRQQVALAGDEDAFGGRLPAGARQQRLAQGVQAGAGAGRQRDAIVSVGRGGIGLVVHVDDVGAGRAAVCQALGDGVLRRLVVGLAAPRQVVQKDHRVGLCDRFPAASDADALNLVRCLVLGAQAGGVDHVQRHALDLYRLADFVAGGAWDRGDDRQLGAGQRIEQRALAHVGLSCQHHLQPLAQQRALARPGHHARQRGGDRGELAVGVGLLQEVDLFFGEIERRFDQRAQPDDALAQGVDLL